MRAMSLVHERCVVEFIDDDNDEDDDNVVVSINDHVVVGLADVGEVFSAVVGALLFTWLLVVVGPKNVVDSWGLDAATAVTLAAAVGNV